MTLPLPPLRRLGASWALALLLAACGGDSPTGDSGTPPAPTVGSVVFTTTPTGNPVVGSAVSLQVRVDDTSGRAMAGQAVAFAATAGTLSAANATTDASGLASVSWTLGTTSGSQTVTATASGRSATATVQATPDSATAFEKVSGDAQSGAAGEQLDSALVISVKDRFGNPRSGEELTVSVANGGGKAGASVAATGSDGRASIAWILGDSLGANSLVVTHALGSLTFTATAVPGAPASVTILSGNGQTGTAGAEVADALSVEVRDRLGHRVPGARVAFVAGNEGKVSADTVATDSLGVARTRWTLGNKAGAQTLEARAGAAPPATFQATAVAGPPSQLLAVSGGDQDGVVGKALAAAVVVEVLDAFDNPVSGVSVAFATPDAGGKVDPAQAETGGDGRVSVTWALGTKAGGQTLAATSQGLAGVTFTAQAAPGAPAQVRAAAGNGQNGTVAQPLGSPLVADVVDAFGNVVPGVPVTFTASAGSVSPASDTTGTDGRASTAWTLGTTSGKPTVEASVAGATPATFTATAAPGPAKAFVRVSGDGQSGPAQSPLASPLVVMARDTFGNGVPGVAVTFGVTAGGGSVSPASTVTGEDGTASAVFTLGTTVGAHTARATAGALGTVDFAATATSGPPAAMSKPAGDAQTRTVGDTLTVTVEVLDAFGNKVPNAAVAFAVTSGGGSVTIAAPQLAASASGATAADGRATATWTLGTTSGSQTLTATVSGAGSVTFTATATPGPATTLAKAAGDDQTATVATPVPTPPRVKASDAFGNGVPGVGVTFAVTSGGGSVTGAVATTGADGTAAVGSWTLGGTAGANTLTASATGLTAVTFTATGVASPPGYDVEIRVIGTMPGYVQSAFAAAEARWESIITGDLPNSSLSASQVDQCGDAPAEAVIVDDLVIYARVAAMDGPGGTLGSAGPCWVRSGSALPSLGIMTFDEADLAAMQTSGILDDVILHEMGHVIGIGTMWSHQGLLVGGGGDDPYFNGPQGIAAYQGLGGTVVNGVPVENTGGSGTRDGHWRETVFDNELMTGWVDLGGNPLSVVTIRSLADQGYTVNVGAADGYALPAPAPAAAAALRLQQGAWEILLKPLGSVPPDEPPR